MNEPTVSDVLREAASVLSERGHCKGTIGDEDGRVCALGALIAAVNRFNLEPAVHVVLSNDACLAVGKKIGKKWFNIGKWNDAPERTGTEVEKLFLQVADEVEVS